MRLFSFILALIISLPAQARLQEFDDIYKVDLQEQIPSLARLEKEYKRFHSNYRWNYDFRWNMSSHFNSEFRQNIKNFGTIEKRIPNPKEDDLLKDLSLLPKPMYQYVGPLLHTVRGLSGKILDLPGIKETKHQFPKQIASRFKDIPNIEYASPVMYLFLSPIFWGEDMASLEIPKEAPKQKKVPPRIRIRPEFISKIKAKVAADYAKRGRAARMAELDLRHFNPDENTPLSKADVRAFANTLDSLKEFRQTGRNEIDLIMLDSLVNYWDVKNGIPKDALIFRHAVNPCQTFVRKIKWSNMQSSFQEVVGKQGFGLDDWAYTCDKVIKAHRVHNAPAAFIWGLQMQRRGQIYPKIREYLVDEEERQLMKMFLDYYERLYTTTAQDIEAIKPYNRALTDKFVDMDEHLAGAPLIFP